ncbi:hypothetical protein [Micromonospora chalcea]|uniref:hypothetical protein n=1 Tax=Micromonospora chalcea TaxID=1874 RepID=UPI003D75BE05
MTHVDLDALVNTLGLSLRAAVPLVGQLGDDFGDKLQEKAIERVGDTASDATIKWAAKAWQAITRRGSRTSQEVCETEENLRLLAAEPDHRSSRKLLLRELSERVQTDEELARDLRDLLDDAPAPASGTHVRQVVSESVAFGDINQIGVVHRG